MQKPALAGLSTIAQNRRPTDLNWPLSRRIALAASIRHKAVLTFMDAAPGMTLRN